MNPLQQAPAPLAGSPLAGPGVPYGMAPLGALQACFHQALVPDDATFHVLMLPEPLQYDSTAAMRLPCPSRTACAQATLSAPRHACLARLAQLPHPACMRHAMHSVACWAAGLLSSKPAHPALHLAISMPRLALQPPPGLPPRLQSTVRPARRAGQWPAAWPSRRRS